jgi:hypothetical protein
MTNTELAVPEYELVTGNAQLQTLCKIWEGSTLLAMDTEFIRTQTFYPQLGLLQLCNGVRSSEILIAHVFANERADARERVDRLRQVGRRLPHVKRTLFDLEAYHDAPRPERVRRRGLSRRVAVRGCPPATTMAADR